MKCSYMTDDIAISLKSLPPLHSYNEVKRNYSLASHSLSVAAVAVVCVESIAAYGSAPYCIKAGGDTVQRDSWRVLLDRCRC